MPQNITSHGEPVYLVIGATGKTGRRVAQRLRAGGHAIRLASRQGQPAFDWDRPSTWEAHLRQATAVYLTYAPDLAMPGAVEAIDGFIQLAITQRVQKIVLLSGRGEPEAQRCEQLLQQSGLAWTIVRSSWFSQNFSEGFLAESVQAGRLILPVADVPEPFVDVDDVADVAFAALTDPKHDGQIYEVTGPRLLTFSEALALIGAALERDIALDSLSESAFVDEMVGSGVPTDIAQFYQALFSSVLDGRNASVANGVERALRRAPRDFSDFVAAIAVEGWRGASSAPEPTGATE